MLSTVNINNTHEIGRCVGRGHYENITIELNQLNSKQLKTDYVVQQALRRFLAAAQTRHLQTP